MITQVEVSLKKVVSYMEKSDIPVKAGQSYNLYACGHIFSHEEDLPQTIHYYKHDNKTFRSCPICGDQKLITKYKKCTCGTEHIGKRVQPSQCCASCPTVLRNAGKIRAVSYKKRNEHLADPDRCFCTRRDICSEWYLDYATIPCLNCGGYEISSGEEEAVRTVR